MQFALTAATLGALATTVLAHGTVRSFSTDGVENQGYLLDYYYAKQNGQAVPSIAAWSAENLDNGFVEPNSFGDADIICHKKAAPGAITAKVAAGGTVGFFWPNWPASHIGPVITYAANCGGDCSKVDKTALKFVKIDAEGYDATTKQWAADKLVAAGGSWNITVPSQLAAGNYVFRHEIIALHGAGSPNGAQNYPQCFNIEVTGSGTESPEGTLGTALYKADDAGILFSPYSGTIDYTIPGPALFGSGGGSPAPAPSASAPASSATSAAASTAAVPTATSAPTATSVVAPVPTATGGAGNSTIPAPTTRPGCNKKFRRHARDVSRNVPRVGRANYA